MKKIDGLKDIIAHFDTFILDQWGVLHNGADAFNEAIEALEFLKSHQKNVVILSNSGKTRNFSYQRLKDSGISRDLYLDVVTSGEHMRHNFRTGKFEHLGDKALFFAWDNDYSVLNECGLVEADLAQASLILCHGIEREGNVANYLDDLKLAYQRNLELVVSNPDITAITTEGKLKSCPGAIAKAYQEMGGIVHWHGKPQPDIYKMCKELIGGWDKAIAVGDSMEHDIVGANQAQVSSLFITSGIHRAEVSDQQSINDLSKQYAASPSYYTDWFKV